MVVVIGCLHMGFPQYVGTNSGKDHLFLGRKIPENINISKYIPRKMYLTKLTFMQRLRIN